MKLAKLAAAALLSFSLALGMAAMTDNAVQARQVTDAAQPGSKAADLQTVPVKTEGAASPKAEEGAAAETVKQQAAGETEKQYPRTEPVAERDDVVAFADAKNGFRVFIPSELQLYPLGVNPVAVLRGEDVRAGVRLAIDATAIDSRGPLMPFQVETFRDDFLRMVRSSVKNSANAFLRFEVSMR